MPDPSSTSSPRVAAALVALPAALGTVPAWAHPGAHGAFGWLASLAHLATAPDHLAIAAAAVAVGALLAQRVRARRRRAGHPTASSDASPRSTPQRSR